VPCIGEEVVILIVGRKVGNKLIVEGEEFHGHQDHLIEPPRLETDLKIQSLDPHGDDSLIDELLASNFKFQALVAKSKASPRKPFAVERPTNG
jgi:hypothetical protein